MKLRSGLWVVGALALVVWWAMPQESRNRVAHEFLTHPAQAVAGSQLHAVQPIQLALLFQNSSR